MVPTALVQLEGLPLTPNGKVDRQRLPEPSPSDGLPTAATPLAPRTPLEQEVAELWQEVLKVDALGLETNFFAAGGHSLLAIQMIGRARRRFEVKLTVAELFDHPTVETFADHVRRRLPEQPDATARASSAEPKPKLDSARGPADVALALILSLLVGVSSISAQTNSLDASFDPGLGAQGGIVETVLPQPDGKVLICGDFTSFNNADRGFVARLNADGSVDESFNAHPGYWVRHMALQADGKIVIGGFFTNVEGLPRNRVARLNSDGSLDKSFDPGTGAETKIVEGDDKDPFVFAVAIQPNGKILIAGNFRTYNAVPSTGLARLNSDGTLDTSFKVGAGIDSWARFLLFLPNDQIMMTGWFTSYDNHPFNRMVRLNSDGSPDLSFKPNFGDETAIYGAVLLPDGKLIVGGHSINSAGLFRQEFARINPDGSYDLTYNARANDKVESIYLQPDGKIIIGGYFSYVNGISRNGLARVNPDGTLDESFKAETDNFVWTVRGYTNGSAVVCGGFYHAAGASRGGVARLIIGGGESVVPTAPQLQAVGLDHGEFYVMVPTQAGHQYALQYRTLDSSAWTSLPTNPGDGTVQKFVDPDAGTTHGRLYRVIVN
jgi:uncharacterized delta-60 repeat protein